VGAFTGTTTESSVSGCVIRRDVAGGFTRWPHELQNVPGGRMVAPQLAQNADGLLMNVFLDVIVVSVVLF
jgi:hypothetical protein